MGRYDLVINGANYSVDIVDLAGNQATVNVNGVTYKVEIAGGALPVLSAEPRAAAPAAAAQPAARAMAGAAKAAPAMAAPAAAPAGGEVISAPMPGHILSVAVKEGDTVEVGDTVLVMEAMKMENEIKAHVSGTIQEVKVSKGQDVGVGEVLIVIGG